jgi:hypothetical protein
MPEISDREQAPISAVCDRRGRDYVSLLEQKRTKVTKKWGWEYSAGDAEETNPALLPSVQIFF